MNVLPGLWIGKGLLMDRTSDGRLPWVDSLSYAYIDTPIKRVTILVFDESFGALVTAE